MSISLREKASVALLAIASSCLLSSPVLSFPAGCTGDAKTGAMGNVELTLYYGGSAIIAILAGIFIGPAGFLLRPGPELGHRAAYAGA